LGTALLAAGRLSDAEARFRRVVDASTERVNAPIEYVRSLYALGTVYEKLGDPQRAREHYARFLEHWREGDLDRDKVTAAERKLRAAIN
jgi:tetratricopeptide (TPR) repeat protein